MGKVVDEVGWWREVLELKFVTAVFTNGILAIEAKNRFAIFALFDR